MVEDEARKAVEEERGSKQECDAVDTDDDNDEEEYELWKIRELKRIKKDREDRDKYYTYYVTLWEGIEMGMPCWGESLIEQICISRQI